jgi:hypothetical protein
MTLIPVAQGVGALEGSIVVDETARRRRTGGVDDHSMLEEDDPATWEIRMFLAKTGNGGSPVQTSKRSLRALRDRAKKTAFSAR